MKLAELFVDIVGNDKRLMQTVGGVAGKLGPIAAAVAGLGLGAMLTSEVAKASEVASHFEKLGVGLSNAADVSGAALKSLQKDIENLGLKLSGVSLDSLYGIATNAAKAGIAGGELMAFTEGVAKLSVAMDDIPADVIVDQLIKINSSFGLPIPTLANLGAAIDKLADSGTSNAADIFNAGGRLAGIAKAAGLQVQDVLALSAAALETGASAEQAAGSIGRFIGALASDDGIAYFAERMKISLETAKEQITKKPLEAMSAFLGSIQGKGLNEASVALKKLGLAGSEDTGVLLNLAGKMGQVGEYTKLAAEQIKTGSQALESYDKAAATAAAASVRLENAWDIAHKKLGDALSPALTSLTNIFADLVVQISQSDGAFAKIAEGSIQFANAVGTLIGELNVMSKLSFAENMNREWNQMMEMLGLDWPQFNEDEIQAKIMARTQGGNLIRKPTKDFVQGEIDRTNKEAEEELKKKQAEIVAAAPPPQEWREGSWEQPMEEAVRQFKKTQRELLLDPEGLLRNAGVDLEDPESMRQRQEDLERDVEMDRRGPKAVEIQGVEERLRGSQTKVSEDLLKEQSKHQENSVKLLDAIKTAIQSIERKPGGARLS